MRRSSRFALTWAAILVLALQGSADPVGPQAVSDFIWQGDGDARFGGFSAIHVAPDGLGFTALTDKGNWLRGRLLRGPGGSVLGVRSDPIAPLLARADRRLAAGRTDSEGIAPAPGGGYFVSFEGPARVLHYRRIDGPAENLPTPREFQRMGSNTALEALAAAADGTLYAIPEGGSRASGPIPVFRFRNGTWDRPFDLPRLGRFRPVSADVGPDGKLYLMERDLNGLGGFSTRLRRFALAGDRVGGGEVLLETPAGRHGNLEGLSVWRESSGRLVATMIADDNFMALLSTRIVEYRLPD